MTGLLRVLGGEFDQVVALLAGVVQRVALQRLGEGPVRRPLLRRELPGLDHPVQDPVPALHRAGVVGCAQRRVVQARALEQRREERGLARVEFTDVLAVVGLRGPLDAVRTAPEPARVEVALQDLVLAHPVVELEGDHGLGELPAHRLVLVQVDVLDVLLGDGRAALGVALADRAPHGAGEALEGDAGVAVETLVLGREHGPADVLGYVLERHRLPLHPAGARHRRPVRPEVDVVLLGRVRVEVRRNVRGRVGDGQEQPAHPEDGERGARRLPPGRHPAPPAGPSGPRVAGPEPLDVRREPGTERGDQGQQPGGRGWRPLGLAPVGPPAAGGHEQLGRRHPQLHGLVRSGGRGGVVPRPLRAFRRRRGDLELHGLIGREGHSGGEPVPGPGILGRPTRSGPVGPFGGIGSLGSLRSLGSVRGRAGTRGRRLRGGRVGMTATVEAPKTTAARGGFGPLGRPGGRGLGPRRPFGGPVLGGVRDRIRRVRSRVPAVPVALSGAVALLRLGALRERTHLELHGLVGGGRGLELELHGAFGALGTGEAPYTVEALGIETGTPVPPGVLRPVPPVPPVVCLGVPRAPRAVGPVAGEPARAALPAGRRGALLTRRGAVVLPPPR